MIVYCNTTGISYEKLNNISDDNAGDYDSLIIIYDAITGD